MERDDPTRLEDTALALLARSDIDVLLTNGVLRDQLHVVDLNDTQRALVWKDDRLAHILGPGRHAFWKTPYAVRIDESPAPPFAVLWPVKLFACVALAVTSLNVTLDELTRMPPPPD